MTWLITNTGREHAIVGTSPQHPQRPITIEEIAHALAQINRLNGHACRPYSVAEHSMLVSDIARAEGASPVQRLAALLHDAHDAYTGDVASPIKWALGQAWADFEHAQEAAVHTALGVRSAMVAHRTSIKRWDLIALATERECLLPYEGATSTPWPILDTPGHEVWPCEFGGRDLSHTAGWYWTRKRDAFLARYHALRESCGVIDTTAAAPGHSYGGTE